MPEASSKLASKDPGADDMSLMKGRKSPGLCMGVSLRPPRWMETPLTEPEDKGGRMGLGEDEHVGLGQLMRCTADFRMEMPTTRG